MRRLHRFGYLLLLPLFIGAVEVPFLTGHVNDTANLLSNARIASLEALLKAHEDSTSNQVVVLTIPTLEDESIEEYSMRVVTAWKLGQKGKDNGVLLVVARDDRKVRIEVGRGLEGPLTDATCGRIIRNEIIPQFKGGDYERGVQAGVDGILAAIQGTYTAEDTAEAMSDVGGRIVAFILFISVVGVFTMIGLISKGFLSWFLYAFLIPFWAAFPSAILGTNPGIMLLGVYLVGYPIGKYLLGKTSLGQKMAKQWASSGKGGSHRWSSSGSSWSSGGGGSSFSGGGGSFSGGGSSGSW